MCRSPGELELKALEAGAVERCVVAIWWRSARTQKQAGGAGPRGPAQRSVRERLRSPQPRSGATKPACGSP